MSPDRTAHRRTALSRTRRLRRRATIPTNAFAADQASNESTAADSAKAAEYIGTAALELAKRANAAGLTALGYLLESAALEAGAEAIARRWPADAAEG